MKVTASITSSDCFNAFKFAAMRIAPLKHALVLILIIVPALLVMFSLAYTIEFKTTYKFVVSSFVLGIIADILILYFIKWTYMKKLQSEKTGTTGSRAIEIDEKGVSITAQDLNGGITWGLVHSVDADKRHIYIFTSALSAVVIPKKAFDKAKDADEFFNKCAQYFKEANKTAVKTIE
ncbi:MAG: YcxB family protein [Eubacteriaceae bacterium]|nr:YcxB family protein [Eubacteriaceae bacterium]